MRQGFRKNVRLGDALDEFLPLFGAVDSETLRLDDAKGRVVGSSVVAERPVPHYDRAAMDGYAVRAEDTHGASEASPVSLEAVDRDGNVDNGEAAYVHTGSAVPEGADAVVRVEETEEVGESIEVSVAVSEGNNVAYTGEDVEEGETVVEEGVRLLPSRLGVLRSVGVEEVEVRRKPNVSVVPTGDEVVECDPAPGEVVGTNGPMVAEYVERWGGEPSVSDVIPDDEDALREAVSEAATDADLVATTGGSSVGERDLLPEVIDEMGEMLVHGVAVKPGHPVGFGVVDETPVVMLPGYPVSCVVNSFEFVRRGVRTLLNVEETPEPAVRCALEEKIPSEVGARTYTRVVVEKNGDGRTARPVRTKGAGVLSSVADADGFVVAPESREGYAEGEKVDVLLWEA
ncbi:MAG: gephyrin-like molybdotransferase Glp [Halobacteriales archaeon]|nr:gephyrin-like molybdotransferase Glp [Halobacteriales archaeon]